MDNYEIERKFLIRYPAESFAASCSDSSTIVQTYLSPGEKGGTERVRKRQWPDRIQYTHTVKKRVNDLRRVEIEREISAAEYEELLKRADSGRRTIIKRRLCLSYKGMLFEIDLYPFWSDRAVMEIELRDESQQFSLPPEIEIIKEVSSDRRYTNSSLARQIPQEEL